MGLGLLEPAVPPVRAAAAEGEVGAVGVVRAQPLALLGAGDALRQVQVLPVEIHLALEAACSNGRSEGDFSFETVDVAMIETSLCSSQKAI